MNGIKKGMKMPTKKQVQDCAKRLPIAKDMLKELFPEAFNDWQDVTLMDAQLRSRDFIGGIAKEVGIMTEGEDHYMPYNVRFIDVWKGTRVDGNPTTRKYEYKLVNNRIFRRKR